MGKPDYKITGNGVAEKLPETVQKLMDNNRRAMSDQVTVSAAWLAKLVAEVAQTEEANNRREGGIREIKAENHWLREILRHCTGNDLAWDAARHEAIRSDG